MALVTQKISIRKQAVSIDHIIYLLLSSQHNHNTYADFYNVTHHFVVVSFSLILPFSSLAPVVSFMQLEREMVLLARIFIEWMIFIVWRTVDNKPVFSFMFNFSWTDYVHCQGECNDASDASSLSLVSCNSTNSQLQSLFTIIESEVPSSSTILSLSIRLAEILTALCRQPRHYYLMARTEFRNKIISDNSNIKWHFDCHRLTLQANNSMKRQLFHQRPTYPLP